MTPARQRNYEIWAASAWALSFAVSAAFGFWNKMGLFDQQREHPGTTVTITLTYLLLAGLGYPVWKGYRWAKLLMAVVLVYGSVRALVDFAHGHVVTGAIPVANSLIQWVLGLATLTLLGLSFFKTKTAGENMSQATEHLPGAD